VFEQQELKLMGFWKTVIKLIYLNYYIFLQN
jgi:hypothetical protein